MQQSKNFHKCIEVFIHKTNCLFHFLLSLCGFEMSGNNNCSWLEANGSPACWFSLVLFQWFLLSERMSAVCARPSLSTLDVISSTWSLRYLLSSTMLPSRCSATWNARLTSSREPSWNCGLNRCRLFLSSLQPEVQEAWKDSSTRMTTSAAAAQPPGKPTFQAWASPLQLLLVLLLFAVYFCTASK